MADSGSVSARRLRAVLAGAVALMLAAVLYKAPWNGGDQYVMKSAYGSNLGASPGFLAMTLPDVGNTAQGVKVYIVDTAKQVICVYAFRNEKIRLVSARQFTRDMDIVDASDVVPSADGRGRISPPEGNNGFDRDTAAAYADGVQKLVEAAEKKR